MLKASQIPQPSSNKIRIIGIDPGLRFTGWGIIEIIEGTNQISHVANGVIKVDSKQELAIRLHKIATELEGIIKSFSPDEASVEEVFVNKNPTSTLKLGMARGVAVVTPVRCGLKVFEYSANKVKKTVVGVGHADKDQVAMMVGSLLPAARGVMGDAADALAIAICHSQYRNSYQSM